MDVAQSPPRDGGALKQSGKKASPHIDLRLNARLATWNVTSATDTGYQDALVAPEVFEKKVTDTFGDIDGVHIIFDDMIIAAVDDDDHIFRTLLERPRAKQVKFNRSKLQLKVKQERYCGHRITPDGIQADSDKVKAILEMPAPTDAKGVQRFIRMINYLSKFLELDWALASCWTVFHWLMRPEH